VTLAITYACNFQCATCNIGKNYLKNPTGIRKGELSAEEIGKIVKSANFSWIQLTGGEPFFRADFYDILKSIKENCPDIYLIQTTTNGYATEHIVKTVKEILALKIPKLVVSISMNGLEDKYTEITGVKNGFKHAIETFKQLKELENDRFEVFISYTASPNNLGLLEKTARELIKEHGISPRHFHMNIFHTSEHYYSNQNIENKKEYANEMISEIRKMREIKQGNSFFIEQ
jgi:molybdenum cofactor biosynthesis enzyme MoaA